MTPPDRSAEEIAEEAPEAIPPELTPEPLQAEVDWTPPPAPEPTRRAVLFYGIRPAEMLPETVLALRRSGVHVTLVGPVIKGYQPLTAFADATIRVRHRASPVPIDPAHRPARFSPAWASVVARNVWRRYTFRLVDKAAGRPTTLWWSLLGEKRVLQAVDDADILTALDALTVYAVWRYARRNARAVAISGLRPTLEQLDLVA